MPCDAFLSYYTISKDARMYGAASTRAAGSESEANDPRTLTHTNTQTYTSLSGVVFRDFSAFSLAAAVPVAAFGMGEV
jgi:hypothetical protein